MMLVLDPFNSAVIKKRALVIGNNYSGADQISGQRDATEIAAALEEIGFEVVRLMEGHVDPMRATLQSFGDSLEDADVVVFFYSGHGYQINGMNYLLPVGSTIDPADPVLSLDEVMSSLGGARDQAVKIVLLEACRTNVALPTVGAEKKLKDVQGWSLGLAKPQNTPQTTLFQYAASFGQFAISGNAGELSYYTSALLSSIREPGLEIRQLLRRVRNEVFYNTSHGQSPTDEGISRIPGTFYLSDPISIHAIIPEKPNDALLVILNGKIVLNATDRDEAKLQLNAGDNELALFVSKGKTYHNNHDWDRTEGWKYRLDLVLPGSTESFGDHEDHPFRDGPHHGKVFEVARVVINVDPVKAVTKVVARDTEVFNEEAPFWAQKQDVLFERSITDLNLAPEEIFSGPANPGSLAPLLRPFLVELLKSGKILGVKVADPSRTFVTVRGNTALESLAVRCMEKRQDRINDLKASITAAFNRDPTPFAIFDHGLTECMRDAAASQGSSINSDDIRIWTAIEDRSDETADARVTNAAVAAMA
jgi:hypothetical protein